MAKETRSIELTLSGTIWRVIDEFTTQHVFTIDDTITAFVNEYIDITLMTPEEAIEYILKSKKVIPRNATGISLTAVSRKEHAHIRAVLGNLGNAIGDMNVATDTEDFISVRK